MDNYLYTVFFSNVMKKDNNPSVYHIFMICTCSTFLLHFNKLKREEVRIKFFRVTETFKLKEL